MTNLDRKISSLETRIAALNRRIVGHATYPKRIANALCISPRLTCFLTQEPRIAYLPSAKVWLSRENGAWRTRSNRQIAVMLRNLLSQDQDLAITQAKAILVERAARSLFTRDEVPGGSE